MFGIATNASVRQWTLAAAGLGLVIATAIATAPKPSCKAQARPSVLIIEPMPRVAWSEPRNPCEPVATFHARSTAMMIEEDLACARAATASPRRAYLAAMGARWLDTDGAYTSEINAELRRLTRPAAEQFLALKDYQNAASAVLVGESLGVESPAFQAVIRVLAPR